MHDACSGYTLTKQSYNTESCATIDQKPLLPGSRHDDKERRQKEESGPSQLTPPVHPHATETRQSPAQELS